MLETDEVDDDYFTPIASTSLASIFGNPTNEEKVENETLKYTPPKSHNVSKQEEPKATTCIFACALVGYEWYNNVYTSKGKLGLALIKILKSDTHKIILYDSKKTTLSNASVSSKLEVGLKGQNYISYYDDQRRYWSLYGTNEEIKKIIDLIQSLGAVIKSSIDTEEIITESNIQHQLSTEKKSEDERNKQKESDTDSSVNKKNKAAILSRMATMGHSVLPTHNASVAKSSDSSDSNSTDNHVKPIRHKPMKGTVKRNLPDKGFDMNKKYEAPIEHSTEIQKIQTFISDHQIIPLPSTSIITSPSGNDMNLFVTEQRISNSELRINMSRVSDKLDQVVTKINDLQVKDNRDFNTEILQKLLKEYECKIKNYETILMKRNTELLNNGTQNTQSSKDQNIEDLRCRINELENDIEYKNKTVVSLKSEMEILKAANNSADIVNGDILKSEITELKTELDVKNHKIKELSDKLEKVTKETATDLEYKIKAIMNETFQSISTNFDKNESYSSETIKNVVASVIKTVTLEALNKS